ncbi:hypothetical protein [Rodentibacter abscessus]|uniref:hypothetical protein n=1 Tax=Rodentibacter abscessus TaxID=3381777 RepID=UPI00399C4E24
MGRQKQTTQSEKDKKINTPPPADEKNLNDVPKQKDKVLDDVPKPDENEADKSNTEKIKMESNIIEPVAYSVKLRSIHPQSSYGRAGFRFTKDVETVINVNDITPDKVILLAEDPWLELIPVCDD